MNFSSLVDRSPVEPWTGIAKIPWHDPDFSERMLKEHLDQGHGAASRPFELISRQVAWLHQTLFEGKAQRVLDLGCGPGLYTERLAGLGHLCVGIDHAPAAIAHAQANVRLLPVDYRLANLLGGSFGSDFTAALFLFGEFNAFPPAEAALVLEHAYDALAPDGLLVIEPHTEEYVRTMGQRAPDWFSASRSVFSGNPHLCLHESHWHEGMSASVDRYFVLEHGACEPVEYVSTHQAYDNDEYDDLLRAAGFSAIRRFDSLSGDADPHETGLFVIAARKV